ncbi:aminotransferase class I/II-fold pyridoxal phosphate-dependent enzyme [Halomonas campisalis]|uniref:Aminotransferase class I/II-fold pyridoxal phosphate-dependent enzyme n=1 Tax=Billgrantia campisalis TaxID=74661 RepID=A0ABS9P936_9GAMM|nr:aminotransferase class I/II-fold pyridoxal phosphate-dependent enzyme [Halomonas campisalis]MCG6658151.1 aminotransferase class I/II-fold pyridoxal phosphate-dependent enzyme [Halomonas campisalis]MDR5862820.1 beta-eliminating lyase-related protein [Halomonas campisalis]
MQETNHTDTSYSALGFYHKISQLRADTWNALKRDMGILVRLNDESRAKNLIKAVDVKLTRLEIIEDYHAFPSKEDFRHLWSLFDREEYVLLEKVVKRLVRALISESYRRRHVDLSETDADAEDLETLDALAQLRRGHPASNSAAQPYFELLIVDNLSAQEEEVVREAFRNMRRPEDRFVYDVVTVRSFEDALIAVLVNPNIQACLIRYEFPYKSKYNLSALRNYLEGISEKELENQTEAERSILLSSMIHELRPEIDQFLVTSGDVEATASQDIRYFNRIFYRETDYIEQHHTILRAIDSRYRTPFFDALREYSRKPTGVFHAMPISRGKSVTRSHWAGQMIDFYGINIFLAETSATSGGLDSLLQPYGPIKKAQEYAARAFGARQSFFVTNGTSTANKIVVQALVKPRDIVLVDRDCHKSHHYGMVLSGAHVSYLDSYPLHDYSMYGAVPLREIKKTLLKYKRAGQLDKVKMLLLTNCTFDGVVYNVRRVMEECLAIKPDLVFLWDEAWFAFAGFNPTYRPRTAMHTARTLRYRYRTDSYRADYDAWKAEFDQLDPDDEATWLDNRLMPDPDQVRIRTYATHSTHKTLTSLRQGSMIHVWDQDYRQKVEAPFHEAYMTHTSTSPNYQIVASLDVGRMQAEMEGFELVHAQVEAALSLREQLYTHPLLQKYFRVLKNSDMVPAEYRESGVESYYDPVTGWNQMEEAWAQDEFVVDPSRVTIAIGATGVDGDTFKNDYLMNKYGIQINKTSRNTVLFMTNIGTTRGSIAYLLDVLIKLAKEFEYRWEESSRPERKIIERRVRSLTEELPPLPDFSRFHDAFRPGGETPEGDIRRAYFLSYDEENTEYLRFDNGELQAEMRAGRDVVSASFVIPYPPGFPVLVPGQVVSEEILYFLQALDVTEIHGYRPELGLIVFTEQALADPPAG